MANGWTPERQARQAAAIHSWQPWAHSTGARTPEGRAKSSRNAFRYTIRKGMLFQRWLCRQANQLRAIQPYASMEEAIRRTKQCGLKI